MLETLFDLETTTIVFAFGFIGCILFAVIELAGNMEMMGEEEHEHSSGK